MPRGVPPEPPPGLGSAVERSIQELAGTVKEFVAAAINERREKTNQQGFRTLKPKREFLRISCKTREAFVDELVQFEIDMNELGIKMHSEACFFQLRACVDGRAKEVLKYELALGPQSRCHSEALAIAAGSLEREARFRPLCEHVFRSMDDAVGLTDEFRIELALKRNHDACMKHDTCDGVYEFLDAYRRGRLQMLRAGMFVDSTAFEAQRYTLPPNIVSLVEHQRYIEQVREFTDFFDRRLSKNC